MEGKNFKKKKFNYKKRSNKKYYNYDCIKNDLNKTLNINNTMRVIKDYYAFVSDKGYDANNICCLLDYEKYLLHK